MEATILNPKDLISDGFALQFLDGAEEEARFKQSVQEFDQAAIWRDIPVTDVRVAATCKLEQVHGDDMAINPDSYLAVKLGKSGGMAYVLRPWACKSLRSLCQDDPGIFQKILAGGRADVIARRLCEDLKFLPEGKSLLFLIRGEKVSGVFGDFNAGWTQSEQIAALKGKLQDMFGNHSFLSGYLSHMETKAEYQLGPSIADSKFLKTTHGTAGAAVLSPYLQTWADAGMDPVILQNAIPTLEFRTGESGLAQLMLVPKIHYRTGRVTTSCILGSPMKVKHRGSDKTVWGTYIEYLTSVAATYQNGIRGIVDLTKKEIKHPYSCLTHLLKALRPSTPSVELWATLEAFELVHPQDDTKPCSAFLLYEVVNDMNQRASRLVSVTKQLQNMEFTAKMLSPKFNWRRFDVSTPANFTKESIMLSDDE